MPQISSHRVSLVVTLLASSYLIFTPLDAFLDHFFDFHLSEEAKEPPKTGVHANDWLIEAERDYCESHRPDPDRSDSPGDDGGRDFTPNRD